MTPQEQYQMLLNLQKNSVTKTITDADANVFQIDPNTGIMKLTTSEGKGFSFNPQDPKQATQYNTMLANLVRDNEKNITSMMKTPNYQTTAMEIGKSYGQPIQKDASKAAIDSFAGLADERKGEARQEAMKRAQRLDLIGKVGVPAVIGAAEMITPWIDNPMDIYSKERVAELEQLKEKGELGLTPEEQTMMIESTMSPVRALAREQRLREESSRAAGMGAGQSVAQQQAIRDSMNKAIAGAAKEAGMSIKAADMAKADQQIRELQSQYAYQGQRKQDRINATLQGLAGIGSAIGAMTGKSRVGFRDTTGILYDIGASQGVDLTGQQLAGMNQMLTTGPVLSDLRFNAIMNAYGIDPTKIDPATKRQFYR